MSTSNFDYLRPHRWRHLALPYLFERGGVDPDHTAVVFQGRSQTYGELRIRMRKLANALAANGIVPMDRVALLTRNRLEYFEIEAGIAAARAIMVPMNWRLRPPELAAIMRRAGACAILVESALLPTILEMRRQGQVPELRLFIELDGTSRESSYDGFLADQPATALEHQPSIEDVHEIIFTSGTTGQPKGVVWTNGGVLFNAMQQVIDFRIGPDSITHVSIDLYYIGGRHDLTWATLYAGGTVHIKESSNFVAEDVLRYVCEHRVSHVLWVPTMIYDLLRTPNLERFDTSHLRLIMSGGQPLSAETTTEVQRQFSHSAFVQVYGLTEGGGSITFVPDWALKAKPGSAGRPSMHAAIRIVDDAGQNVPTNVDGEIWVRAPSMAAGYWNDPELTNEMFDDDWLRTGDVGQLDDDGFLYVTGRKKDMIISGGMNIFPSEIEDVLRGHPAVRDVAVIGVPDQKWGERVCAVIELHADARVDEAALINYCTERVASYKKPTTVWFIDSMPRTATGKQQKYILRERYGGRFAP